MTKQTYTPAELRTLLESLPAWVVRIEPDSDGILWLYGKDFPVTVSNHHDVGGDDLTVLVRLFEIHGDDGEWPRIELRTIGPVEAVEYTPKDAVAVAQAMMRAAGEVEEANQ